jgi:Arc/MetJ-type ribon-helix-helix transcriptional regulator
MKIKLSPLMEAIIENEITSGRFTTPEDVILQALRCLQETTAPPVPDEWLVEARAQADRGESVALTEELRAEIRRQAIDDARLGNPVSDDVKY